MSVNLSEYLPVIRRRIRDQGISEHEEYIGDGVTVEYYLSATPVSAGDITVYLDNVETTSYFVDTDTGAMEFDSAPGENVVIKVLYKSYGFSDTELVEYLEEAIEEGETLWDDESFTTTGDAPYSYIDTAPTAKLFKLWLLILHKNLMIDMAAQATQDSISWSAEEMSVNRTAIVEKTIIAIDKIEEEIKRHLWYMTYDDITGLVIAGGSDVSSSPYVRVGDPYIIEWRYYRGNLRY